MKTAGDEYINKKGIMMRRTTLSLFALIAAVGASPVAASDDSNMIGNGALYAVGVATPDVENTAEEYQRIFGIIPAIFGAGANAVPDGRKSELKMAGIFFPNFYIKLQQGLNDIGPFVPFVEKRGTGIMNFQIHVTDPQAVRKRLEKMGGRWVLGAPTDFWAYIDMTEDLGIMLEPIDKLNSFPVKVDPLLETPLGIMPVTHVGIAVDNAAKAARKFSKLFAIPLPTVTEIQGVTVASGIKSETRLKIASWKQGKIGIELTETTEPSPWRDFVQKNGIGAYSIGFDVGDRIQEMTRQLEAKGGKLIFQTPDESRSYLDFTNKLGFVIELNGQPSSKVK